MNIYEVLTTKPHNERQLKRYLGFIHSRRSQTGPLEKHHTCPKANDLFPEYYSFTDHPWNRIDLTPREHYVAHLLLWKAYGGSQTRAVHMMTPQGKRSSRLYESIKTGITVSEETKANMSAGQRGRKLSDETKAKLSLAAKGRTPTPEARANMSAAASKRRYSEEARASRRGPRS